MFLEPGAAGDADGPTRLTRCNVSSLPDSKYMKLLGHPKVGLGAAITPWCRQGARPRGWESLSEWGLETLNEDSRKDVEAPVEGSLTDAIRGRRPNDILLGVLPAIAEHALTVQRGCMVQ